MTLRARLITAFVAIAIFVLGLFGILAHRIATETGDDRQIALLKHLAVEEGRSRSPAALLAQADAKHQFWALRSRDGIWRMSPAGEWPLDAHTLESLMGSELTAESQSGVVEATSADYLWVGFHLADGSSLIRLHPRTLGDSRPLTTLGSRLIVVAVLVIGLAVWAAVVLAGRISRHQERYQKELRHMALHDALTGLPNRLLLDDRLEQAIRTARRKRSYLAVFMLDLDRFKQINDTLGHQVGDLALKHIAKQLKGALRASDTIARFGGDEFCIVAPVSVYEEILGLLQKVQEALAVPYVIGPSNLHLGASIGAALFPAHGEDGATLVRRADVAMYAAKRSNKGFSVYEIEDDRHNLNRLSLVCDIRRALDENQLRVYYQPKVNLKSGDINSVEALVRWDHPERGLLSPDVFVPLAEESGSIEQLTFYVLREALKQVKQWTDQGLEMTMAVNLSLSLLHNEHLPMQIRDVLKETGARPNQLLLEITESAIMSDPKRAMSVASLLAEDGIRLAIDDFGSGYSSLAYLKAFPVEEIKIDKSFVLNMNADKNDAHIVRTTIDLAHSLGLNVVAEGVENQMVWQRLYSLNCNSAQGFYLGMPQPAHELTPLLQTNCDASA